MAGGTSCDDLTLSTMHDRATTLHYSRSPGTSRTEAAHDVNIIFLGHVALVRGVAAYSHQTFQWTICRPVCRSVCPQHCGKMEDQIRMPFGIIGQTGPGMRQVVEFGYWSMGRGTFEGKFGARHCNQWGLTFAATWPYSKITLGRLVIFTYLHLLQSF